MSEYIPYLNSDEALDAIKRSLMFQVEVCLEDCDYHGAIRAVNLARVIEVAQSSGETVILIDKENM